MSDRPINYIDPATGIHYPVAPRQETVRLAEKLGYFPASGDDDERAFEVMFPADNDAGDLL